MLRDFALYEQALVRYCDNDMDRLNSSLCRQVCRLDPNGCRERRRSYCATKTVGEDQAVDQYCSCYWPQEYYDELVAKAIESSTVSETQRTAVKDILANSVSLPVCFYQQCAESEVGADTEITTQCASIGMCVQSINVGGVGGVLDVSNNCLLSRQPLPPVETTLVQDYTWAWWLLGLLLLIAVICVVVAVVRRPKQRPLLFLPVYRSASKIR